jgi:transposase-like protein
MHATSQMIASALKLYFTCEPFRNVKKFLKLQGVKMGRGAIYKSIKKYIGLMRTYLEKITPNISDPWRADHTVYKPIIISNTL